MDPEQLGYALMAYIRVTTPPERYPKFLELAHRLPEVLECHHVTGSESFILKTVVPSIHDLEALIARFSPFGQTATSIVLSTPVSKRVLEVAETLEPKPAGKKKTSLSTNEHE